MATNVVRCSYQIEGKLLLMSKKLHTTLATKLKNTLNVIAFIVFSLLAFASMIWAFKKSQALGIFVTALYFCVCSYFDGKSLFKIQEEAHVKEMEKQKHEKSEQK